MVYEVILEEWIISEVYEDVKELFKSCHKPLHEGRYPFFFEGFQREDESRGQNSSTFSL